MDYPACGAAHEILAERDGRLILGKDVMVVDAETGERYRFVIAANATEGWFIRAARENGHFKVDPDEPDRFVTERIERPIRITDLP